MKGQWLMRILWGMLVVAFLLAAASLVMVREVGAAPWAPPDKPGPTGCLRTLLCYTYNRPCDSCMTGDGRKGAQVRAVYRLFDPCWGYDSGCIIDQYIACIPCSY